MAVCSNFVDAKKKLALKLDAAARDLESAWPPETAVAERRLDKLKRNNTSNEVARLQCESDSAVRYLLHADGDKVTAAHRAKAAQMAERSLRERQHAVEGAVQDYHTTLWDYIDAVKTSSSSDPIVARPDPVSNPVEVHDDRPTASNLVEEPDREPVSNLVEVYDDRPTALNLVEEPEYDDRTTVDRRAVRGRHFLDQALSKMAQKGGAGSHCAMAALALVIFAMSAIQSV